MTESRRPDTAQLGCGTLIPIALTVLFFGQDGDDELRQVSPLLAMSSFR